MIRRPARPRWHAIRTPLALAIVSLAAAIALWVAVTDAENPNKEAVFNGVVEVTPANLPEGLAVSSVQDPAVRLRLRGDQTALDHLSTADFRAVVDLSGVRPGTADYVVLPQVIGRKDVEIVEALPPVVSVTIEQSSSKQVPVRANLIGSPAQGFSVTNVDTSPGTVQLTGAQSIINLAASAVADVNLTGLRVNLQQQATLIPRDSKGADLRWLNVDPANVDLKVTLTQQEVTLGLTIVPQLQGTLADGYNLVSATVDPPALAVSGPIELLQAVSVIPTEAVDISGLRADATRSAKLRLPTGLQTTRDSVTVRLKVVPAPGEVQITVAPQVTNVGEGLKATVQTSSLNLRLSGDMPVLRGLNTSAVRATVSAAGLDEGVHVLKPQVALPEGIQVAGIDPPQVVVVLRR